MALFADAALGQSLSIINKGESGFWIEAAAPPDTRYVLQASENMHLWVDIHDEVWSQLSYRFDSAGVTKRFFRLTSWAPPAPPIIIVLLGDSTTSDCCGWGQGMYGYFKPNARVVNYAQPWTSTRTFLHSTEMNNMLLVRPDFVLMQFGLEDAVSPDPDHRTTLQEYADNFKTIVQTVRGFNGTPILITPSVHRWFDDKGKVIPIWGDRSAVVRNVAAELKTHLIDLNQLTTDLYNELGESGCQFMTNQWLPDNFHFSPEGAQVISGVVVKALPDSLGPYLMAPPKP